MHPAPFSTSGPIASQLQWTGSGRRRRQFCKSSKRTPTSTSPSSIKLHVHFGTYIHRGYKMDIILTLCRGQDAINDGELSFVIPERLKSVPHPLGSGSSSKPTRRSKSTHRSKPTHGHGKDDDDDLDEDAVLEFRSMYNYGGINRVRAQPLPPLSPLPPASSPYYNDFLGA